MRIFAVASAATVALALVACASTTDTAGSAAPGTRTDADGPACTDGETRCDGDGVATCRREPSGVLAFGPAEPCDGDAVCKEGACVEPTAKQRMQARELESMVGYLKDNTAWHAPLDWGGITTEGRRSIFRGDGSGLAYFSALFHAFVAVPQGHQGLYLASGCGKLVPTAGYAQRGACGRPHERGIVVTHARANNPLGLVRGDLVVGVAGRKGKAVLEELARRPACAASRPSASFADTSTATTFADLLRPGEEIEVESPSGERRAVTVPEGALRSGLSGSLDCSDPLGRDVGKPVESYVRPDGVAVIRLPGFMDPEQTFPTSGSLDDIEAYRERFEAKIQAAFDAVKSAPAIVWDVRGNGGGLTLVGLHIASGFPGAKAGKISSCVARRPGSDPPAFDTFEYAEYALTPGGRFAYAGKVAVLTDGLDYSAADYFPLAAKEKTSAILVGAPTAGGFGATSDSKLFAGPPSFSVSVDLNRCSSARDGAPLEGRSVTPHVAVDYDPKELAAGTDTVLERAVAELKR